jgi:DNA mismatch endonuclease (patch repair protein)
VAKKAYLRDGRSPVPLSESTSKVMSANKGRDTKPEITLRKALWANDARGYRRHLKQLPGRPDISYSKNKLAIFVNGCFWHRCPHCKPHSPKSNVDFWREKFKKNISRDREIISALKKAGWKCLVIWECEVKNNLAGCVISINKLMK